MIQSKTIVTDSSPEGMLRLRKILNELETGIVTVGLHDDAGKYSGVAAPEVIEVGFWMEFGTQPHGNHPGTPEYAWMRSTIDNNTSKINKWRDDLLIQILDEKITVMKGLETLGFLIQVLIQNTIKKKIPPPNKESTLAGKKRDGVGNTPLIHTGLLLRSITFKATI